MKGRERDGRSSDRLYNAGVARVLGRRAGTERYMRELQERAARRRAQREQEGRS
jgi:hypothetical protein